MPGVHHYFSIISKISEAFETTKEMDALLHLIVESAVETMNAKAASLFLADERKKVFRPVAQTGLSDRYFHIDQPAEQIDSSLNKDGYIYYRDAATDPRLQNHELKKAEGIGSILAIPALIKGKLVGVLSLYTDKIREFTRDEIDFLKILAEQGALAIENARLVESIRRHTMMFSDLAANITSSLDVKTILQTLTADTAKALDVKGVTIRLLNDERTAVQLVASFGFSERYLKMGDLAVEKNIAQALNGKTVTIVDTATDKGVQRKKALKEEGIVSLLFVPIKAKEEIIGVLGLGSATKRVFTEGEIRLVTALANLGGVAIQNASLYLMIQNDLKDMKEESWTYKCWF